MAKIFMLLGCLVTSFLFIAAKGCEEASDTSAKDVSLECSSDSDCAETDEDCCSCKEGGKKIAVAKKSLKALKEARLDECADIMCLQMISNDPSCKQKPKCVGGQCLLQ